MFAGRLLSALVVVALGLLVVDAAFADVGSGSSSVPVVTAGSGSGSGAAPATLPAPDAALQTALEAYHKKDWFMLAGALGAVVIAAVKWLLSKKWPQFEEDHWGVMLAAGLSGLGALVASWYTGTDIASSHTLIGAVKLFAFAVAAYVSQKKIITGFKNTGTASSSDVPA